MRELSFMGPSNDGQRLLLVAEDGTEFELPVDDRLVSVVSREHGAKARPPAPAATAPTPSPRDIQDRIRHGATIEQLAESAGVSPEQIARFAHPVVTERAHIATQARETIVAFGSEHIALEDAVAERVKLRGVDSRLIRWDAWRSDDGRWTVVAAYPASQGDRTATFSFSPAEKSIHAADDEARWLIEQSTAAAPEPPAAAPPASAFTGPRSVPNAPVPESPDEEAAPAPRSWDRAHPAARAHERREANGESLDSPPEAESAAAAGRVSPSHPAAGSAPRPQAEAAQSEAEPAAEPRSTEKPRQEPPQWEELLFGTPPTDEDR